MNIISKLLFLLSCFFCNGQTYTFDVMTNYKINKDAYNGDIVNFGNTKNASYTMQLFNKNGILTATIYDSKNEKMHHFNVAEKFKNLSNQLTFIYEYSYDYDYSFIENYHTFRIIFFKTDNDSILKMKYFKRKKDIQVYDEFTLYVNKNEKNLFPMFQFAYLHGPKFKKAEVPYNFLVKSVQIGNKIVCKLLDKQNVDLTIEVPQ